MEQSITIKIAGKQYPLKAKTPEMERLIRLSADSINRQMTAYSTRYPDSKSEDRITFVAINESAARIAAESRLKALEEEIASLKASTQAYLEKNLK